MSCLTGGLKRGAGQDEAAVVPVPPKKTRGRVKLENEFIENLLKRRKVFSVRKNGIMKKLAELTTLTGTQAVLLVRSETQKNYTFATDAFQPMIDSEAGKALIRSCLDDSPQLGPSSTTEEESSGSGFQIREQQHSHTPSTTPSPPPCNFRGKMDDVSLQDSETESLDSTDDETELSLDTPPETTTIITTTTTTSSGSSNQLLPTMTTTTITALPESNSLELQPLHSDAPGPSLPPMEDRVMDPWMEPSAPGTAFTQEELDLLDYVPEQRGYLEDCWSFEPELRYTAL